VHVLSRRQQYDLSLTIGSIPPVIKSDEDWEEEFTRQFLQDVRLRKSPNIMRDGDGFVAREFRPYL
jgi:hypothetical protein